jgi:uncharacterized protein YbjQ (UPF0145 family)
MSIFNRSGWGEEGRREQSRQRLADGGLPLEAEGRIYHLKQSGRFFSSELTPSELAMLGSRGIRPVAHVTGAAVYRLGWNPDPLSASGELPLATQGCNEVRVHALDRLTQEAKKLGAHGIVGIEIARKPLSNSADLRDCAVEVSAQGTAIAWDKVAAPEAPFLTTLTAIDVANLLDCGYLPAGIVASSSIWYQIAGFDTRWANQTNLLGRSASAYNTELKDYTRGFYEARERAIMRVQRQTADLNASGALALSTDYRLIPHEIDFDNQGRKEKRHDLIVELHILGSAIRELRDKPVDVGYGVFLSP